MNRIWCVVLLLSAGCVCKGEGVRGTNWRLLKMCGLRSKCIHSSFEVDGSCVVFKFYSVRASVEGHNCRLSCPTARESPVMPNCTRQGWTGQHHPSVRTGFGTKLSRGRSRKRLPDTPFCQASLCTSTLFPPLCMLWDFASLHALGFRLFACSGISPLLTESYTSTSP